MPWLLEFIDTLIKELPEDLKAEVISEDDDIKVIIFEADELWSYIGSKENPQWLWLVMHSKTRQIIAMQVGPRDKQTAEKLFFKLPEPLKKKPSTILINSLCMTRPLHGLKHQPVGKESGKTGYIERFNFTLRQRIPRLVRKTLSFSKKLANHVGIIKYFICDYNLMRRALHV